MLQFISRPFSRTLRNALIRQHPWFSCCASCSEIKKPVKNNLCTSISPNFKVDLVLMPQNSELNFKHQKELFALSLKFFLNGFPWVRKIIVTGYEPAWLNSLNLKQSQKEKLTCYDFKFHNKVNQDDKLIRTILNAILNDASLSEHLLIATTDTFVKNQTSLLDYFTPNGIPLNYLNPMLTEENLTELNELLSKPLALQTISSTTEQAFFQQPLATTKESLKEIFYECLKNDSLNKDFFSYTLPSSAYI
ncbi:hypothetical protein, partial [Desulfovibrio litoralis]